MAEYKYFTLKPKKQDQLLTSFQAPQLAQASQSFQTKPTAPKPAPVPSYSNQFAGPGGNVALGQGTNVNNQVRPATPSKPFDNSAALAGLQRQATEQNALYESRQVQGAGEPVGTIASADGSAPAVSGGDTGGSGTTGAGAGGYIPPGLSKIEEGQEGVDTERPSPGGVEAQPFTQGGGALAVGEGGTQPQTLASKYESGFNAANAALGTMGGGVGGISGAQGAAAVQQYSPTKSNTPASLFVQSDPFIEGLVTAWQDYINPQNQRKSLADTYNQMIKDSGIQALDTELLNMKNVIEGSEEDLRTEITKAGGMATNSQILALTNARNKQLIKNYNTLLDTRNAKEKYLETAIQLEQSDRESADRRFESAFNMGLQIANYRQQMQTNARNQMQFLVQNLGFDGLYDATGGDPFIMELVESTLGIPRGGLLSTANKARQAKLQAQQEAQLDLQLKQQQLKTPEERALETKYRQAQLRNLDADTKKIYNDMAESASGNKKLSAGQYTALGYGSRLIQSGQIINDVGNQFARLPQMSFKVFGKELVPGFLKRAEQKQYEQAKKNFVNAVLRRESGAAISPDEFKSAEEQYFPVWGDDETTLQNKLENRNLVSANFLREGGMDEVDPTKLTVSPSGELIELLD